MDNTSEFIFLNMVFLRKITKATGENFAECVRQYPKKHTEIGIAGEK